MVISGDAAFCATIIALSNSTMTGGASDPISQW
jgi:hypothetical protein